MMKGYEQKKYPVATKRYVQLSLIHIYNPSAFYRRWNFGKEDDESDV